MSIWLISVSEYSYTYITDNKFMPLAILNLPYLEDDVQYTRDLNNFLIRLIEVYLFMLLIAIAMAYFLSTYITKSLKTVSDKINQTRLDKRNKKIDIGDASVEIFVEDLLGQAHEAISDRARQRVERRSAP